MWMLLFPTQVIVEKVPKSTIPDIDKKKFLVPADLSGMWAVSAASQASSQTFPAFPKWPDYVVLIDFLFLVCF